MIPTILYRLLLNFTAIAKYNPNNKIKYLLLNTFKVTATCRQNKRSFLF